MKLLLKTVIRQQKQQDPSDALGSSLASFLKKVVEIMVRNLRRSHRAPDIAK